jgi:CheY-like chemotaxis protein
MRAIRILLVEDNEGDIVLTKEALEEGNITNELDVVRDGQQAIDFLEKKWKFSSAKSPDLILLDINLPKLNGHEVLKHIKSSENLKTIPVIMLTTSSSENDVKKAYDHHANCYIVKPVIMDEFIEMIAKIEEFWMNIVKYRANNDN